MICSLTVVRLWPDPILTENRLEQTETFLPELLLRFRFGQRKLLHDLLGRRDPFGRIRVMGDFRCCSSRFRLEIGPHLLQVVGEIGPWKRLCSAVFAVVALRKQLSKQAHYRLRLRAHHFRSDLAGFRLPIRLVGHFKGTPKQFARADALSALSVSPLPL